MIGSSTTSTLDRLAERRGRALAGDRGQRVAAQHELGQLAARERIELLLDEGSFEELGMLAGQRNTEFGLADRTIPGDGVVGGFGTISGRTVFAFAKDVTVFDGSLSQARAQKIMKIQDMALRNRAPIVGLFDAGGARIQEGFAAFGGYAEICQRNALASGVIPQISVIMGRCAGAEAFSPALTDFVFMVRGTGSMVLAGSDVVKAATNETVTEEALGGACVHTVKSSVADGAYANDVEALLQIRRLVDFLPTSNATPPPEWPAPAAASDDPSLDTLVPSDPLEPYDIGELIAKTADDGDVFEIQAAHAKTIVTAFGRVEGRAVGFVANQPNVLAGVLDADACRKAARFVRFCDCFGLPIVTFVDVPGFLPGVDPEHGGLIKHGAKLLYAYAEATVPKITVVTRRAFGGAYGVMASKHLRGDLNFAWPTAQIAAFRGDADDAEKVAARTQDDEDRFLSPFVAAGRGFIDEVILPRETRRKVGRGLAMLRGKALDNPWKKHGNMPL